MAKQSLVVKNNNKKYKQRKKKKKIEKELYANQLYN